MPDPQFVLALDSGSQSSRALLFHRSGEVVASACHTHAPMKYPEPGAVEQDPIDIRDALYQSIADCLAQWGKDPGLIAATALTTQRSTVLPVGQDGAPMRDAVSWLDRRTASIASEPDTKLRLILNILGENSLIPRLLAKSWPRQWRERDPELLASMRWIAPIEAWLLHQLTGHMAMAPGGVVGPWPFDPKKMAWSSSALLYKLLGYKKEWLPDIVAPCSPVGSITKEVAAKTGLPEGLLVIACGGDKQAEAVGAGLMSDRKGVAAVSLGTGSSICIPFKRPVQSPRYQWITMAAAEPNAYCLEYLVFRGMWTVRWFSRELARDLEARCAKTGEVPEALLCEEAGQVAPGADGLMVWPRWSPTLQFPMETGAAVGLREIHTRGHFFRALLEGIAYDLKRGLGILEKGTRTQVQQIYVGGGGSRSDVVVQILSNVLGLPVVRPPSEELAARGAAIVAAIGAGLYDSPRQAIQTMVPEASQVQPQPQHAAMYANHFKKVYVPGLKQCHRISSTVRSAFE